MSLIIYGGYCVNYCCFDECAEGKVEKSDGTNQDRCKTTSGIYIHVNRLISKTKGAIVIMNNIVSSLAVMMGPSLPRVVTRSLFVLGEFIQVPETEKATKKMVSIRLSDYDLLLMQISKYDKTKLKKATTVSQKLGITI